MQDLFRLRRWRITMVALFVVVVMLLLTTGSVFAVGNEPTYGTATIDGNTGEWDLNADFFATMWRAGRAPGDHPNPVAESNLYLRYDCQSNRLYVLVLSLNGQNVLLQPDDAFVKLGNPTKLIDGNLAGIATNKVFSWVNSNGSNANGFEAGFDFAEGSYSNLNVHVQVNNGGSQTSAVAGRAIPLSISCPETGSITVYKQVLPIEADRAFDFTFTNGNTVTPFAISDEGAGGSDSVRVFDDLPAGSYSIAEVLANLPANWAYNGATCATTEGFPPEQQDVVALDLPTPIGDGSVTVNLAAGQDVFCHFGNTYTPPNGTLVVQKVVEGDGDPNNPNQTFELDIQNSNGIGIGGATVMAGDVPVGLGLASDSYFVAESELADGWTLTDISCVSRDGNSTFGTFVAGDTSLSVELAAGDRVLCTFTNTYIQTGDLEITKVVDWNGVRVNANQTFEICIQGPSYPNGDEQGACQEADHDGSVLTWADILVGEYIVTETNPGDAWNVEISSSPATVVTDQTTQVTVTNTHDAAGAIYYRKVAEGEGYDPAQTFSIRYSNGTRTIGSTTVPINSGWQGRNDLQPDEWNIREISIPDNWELTNIVCTSRNGTSTIGTFDPNTNSLDIELASNDRVDCVLTNTYTPPTGSITIIKNVVEGDTEVEFDFGFFGDGPQQPFTLSHGETPVLFDDLEAGEYAIAEYFEDGWFDITANDVVCESDGDSTFGFDSDANNMRAGALVTLAAGDDVTCTFNNTQEPPPNGTLTLIKTVPVDQVDSSPFFDWESTFAPFDGLSMQPTITGSVGTPPLDAAPGTYTIEEVFIPNGWYLGSIDCGDATVAEAFELGDTSVSVTVGAGEDVVCTFYNELRANIIIQKDVTVGDEDQVFDFVFDDGSDFSFPLSETGGEDGLFDALIPGDYTITEENLPEGWTLDDVVCESSGANSSFSAVADGVTVSLASGEDVTCTFENSQEEPELGLIKVFKYYDVNENGSWFFEPPLYGFEFVVYDELGNQVGPSQVTGLFGFAGFVLEPGNYTVCELLPQGWLNTEPGTIDATYNQPCVEVHLSEHDIDLVAFGNHEAPGSIRVTKFNDLNLNGDRNNGEDRLPGWTFEVYEGNAPVGSPIRSNETNSNGRRNFNNLSAGTYTVCEVMQDGWTNTTPLCQTVEVVGGERTDVEFGNVELPPVTDTCGAIEVVSFNQGLDRNFNPIVGARSNPSMALGAPQNNDTINFVSLGFGGELILRLDGLVVDDNGGDFDLFFVETSFGNPSHASYPESVEVFISLLPNGPWTSIGSLTQDGGLDFPGNGASALYVRLVDTSNRGSFSSSVADGYDLDGILCDEPDGEIVVTKRVNWNGADEDPQQTFTLCIDGDNLQAPLCGQVGYNGGSVTFYDIEPGEYSVYEWYPGDEWTVSGGGSVNVASGQTRHSTITNTHDEPEPEDGRIVVTKRVVDAPDGFDGMFTICVSGGALAQADCQQIGPNGGDLEWVLPAGSYVINENHPGGYWLVSGSNHQIELAEGETETHTITNTYDAPPPPPVEQVGTIRVTKNVVTPPAEHGDFTICIQNAVFPTDQQNQPACYNVHNNGDQVWWNVVIGENQQSASVTIVENNPGANWSVDGSGASVAVYPNQTSYHTITNTYTAPPPPSCEGGMGSQSHLSGVITISGLTAYGTVYNNSDVEDCQYQIGMASYLKYDEIIDNQVIFAGFDTVVTIPAGGSVQLSIALPECATQVDLFYGTFLPNLNGQRYGSRLLAYVHHGGNYCEVPGVNPPPQDPPAEEQQPPVEEQP